MDSHLGAQLTTQQQRPFDPRPRLVSPDLFATALESSDHLLRPIVTAWHLFKFEREAVGCPAMMQMLDDLPQAV
jgi:hypothetical protein